MEQEVCIPASADATFGELPLDIATARGYGHPAVHNASSSSRGRLIHANQGPTRCLLLFTMPAALQ